MRRTEKRHENSFLKRRTPRLGRRGVSVYCGTSECGMRNGDGTDENRLPSSTQTADRRTRPRLTSPFRIPHSAFRIRKFRIRLFGVVFLR